MENRSVNPFVHRLKFRKRDIIEIFIGTLILFPIRFILSLLLFVSASQIAKFGLFLIEKRNLENEKHKLRRIFIKLCIYVLRLLFFIVGFYRIKVIDKRKLNDKKDDRIIVIAPHTSPFDIITGIPLKAPSCISRHDAVDIPFFGNLVKLVDPVFVERDSPLSRQNVILSVKEMIKHNSIAFFPEGTTTNRKVFAQFKTGAFKLGLPVQPIVLKYQQYGGDTNGPDTLSWTWDGPSAYISIWLTFSRFRTDMEVIKLPVYYPSEEEIDDPQLYANNVCDVMSKESKIHNSMYSFEDVKFLNYNVPRTPVCMKLLKIWNKLMDFEEKIDKKLNIPNDADGDVQNGDVQNGDVLNGDILNGDTLRKRENGYNHKDEDKSKESENSVKNSVKRKVQSKSFEEFLAMVISSSLEKIKLMPLRTIESQSDLIEILGLNNVPNINHSDSVNQLWYCLRKVTQTPNTIHLSIVLHLCDVSESKIWNRIENCFKLLVNNESQENATQLSISRESFEILLWYLIGIDHIDDCVDISEPITFDYLKHNMIPLFERAAEENLSHILKGIELN